MASTLEGIVEAMADARTLETVAAAVARGALTAATGNSGIILGQALNGLCGAWSELDEVGPCDLRRGLRAASDRARQAVLDPVEGTILTVARATADAVDRATGKSVPELLVVAATAAGDAVEATSDQLDALRVAGVVDAAGRGYELCVRALAATVGALPSPAPPAQPGVAGPAGHEPRAAVPAAGAPTAGEPTGEPVEAEPTAGEPTGNGPAFEVQYVLEAPATAVAGLRDTLGRLGESVTIGGGGGSWSVHVHTDDAGGAVEAAFPFGTPSRIRIAYLHGSPPRR